MNRAERILQRLTEVVASGYVLELNSSGTRSRPSFVATLDFVEDSISARGETPVEALEVVLDMWEERAEADEPLDPADPQAMTVANWPKPPVYAPLACPGCGAACLKGETTCGLVDCQFPEVDE